jgi:hypothetical protein
MSALLLRSMVRQFKKNWSKLPAAQYPHALAATVLIAITIGFNPPRQQCGSPSCHAARPERVPPPHLQDFFVGGRRSKKKVVADTAPAPDSKMYRMNTSIQIPLSNSPSAMKASPPK